MSLAVQGLALRLDRIYGVPTDPQLPFPLPLRNSPPLQTPSSIDAATRWLLASRLPLSHSPTTRGVGRRDRVSS
ncbi:hypothetical protein Isop_2307 [Isosphaera pallida ATCC 43644]|uniref:Uncharacterized protein n=1 Tax=Isosphaera pallida (strain ATCC 43644 / DSM 9630 / IS1B) TaxID=575540 RepID=E8R6H4_ISOPI|nr:hypothetical protein Isop_2307 [Isosphaera pallida ATCC 43644]